MSRCKNLSLGSLAYVQALKQSTFLKGVDTVSRSYLLTATAHMSPDKRNEVFQEFRELMKEGSQHIRAFHELLTLNEAQLDELNCQLWVNPRERAPIRKEDPVKFLQAASYIGDFGDELDDLLNDVRKAAPQEPN